jgi:hypothetical protein
MRNLTRGLAAGAVAVLLTGGAALLSGVSDAATAPAAPQARGHKAPAAPHAGGHKALGAPAGTRAQRLRAAGVHGDAVFRGKGGTFTERVWQRGAVTAKAETGLTVKSADGVTWTWTVNATTRIARKGGRTELTAVAVGDRVLIVGTPPATPSGNRTAGTVRIQKEPAHGTPAASAQGI